jgi:hypothetical protein
MVDGSIRDTAPFPNGPGQCLDVVSDVTSRLDVFLDLFDGPQGKFLFLVHGTKLALIPRAIPGHPQEEAPRFARRPDRSLFKALGPKPVHGQVISIDIVHGFSVCIAEIGSLIKKVE